MTDKTDEIQGMPVIPIGTRVHVVPTGSGNEYDATIQQAPPEYNGLWYWVHAFDSQANAYRYARSDWLSLLEPVKEKSKVNTQVKDKTPEIEPEQLNLFASLF